MNTRSTLACRLLAALLLFGAGPAAAGPVTLEPAEVGSLRALLAKDNAAAKVYDELRATADAALIGRPNPIALVDSAGRLDKDPVKVRTNASLDDMEKVEALAWTWAVTGDARYATQGRSYILAWAKVNRPDGHPINETKFEPMIEAYDLLRPGFSATERDTVDGWLRAKARALQGTTRAQRENWESHRLKIIGLIGATIGDRQLWDYADAGFKKHLRENFEPNGESYDLKTRDALHYHVYSLQPLLTLACVAQRSGDPLYAYHAGTGASLQQAVEYLQPYASGEKKHLEFANSQVSFDRKRAAAGEKEYSNHYWNPKASARMYSEAGCLEPKYNEVAAAVAGSRGKRYLNWRSVLNVAAPAK